MGRSMPIECEHGRIVDWGDFGSDPDDGSVGAQPCAECDAVEAVLQARARAEVELLSAARRWVEAMTVHPAEWARANEVQMIRAVRCLCPDLQVRWSQMPGVTDPTDPEVQG